MADREKEFLKELNASLPRKIAREIIAEFEKPNSNAPERWIWELLQNAKDSSFDEGVDIEVTLTDSYVEFLHNGMPFTQKDIICLLTKDSTKTPDFSDSEKFEFFNKLSSGDEISSEEVRIYLDKTGKFGTGFMTYPFEQVHI